MIKFIGVGMKSLGTGITDYPPRLDGFEIETV
jgi:hypothetical protein